ncbi:MAG TPA: amidase [Acidimicrobiales bacterium]|nr:amidase [Acidimicrobiales bacterium]
MTDTPWQGDTCSLVDAFRAGERSPSEELEATYAAIDASELNCFSYLDREQATDRAAAADVSKPFGGVPTGIKELDSLAGWPATQASLVFADQVATKTATMLERAIDAGGIVPVGMTTASEFGGLNVSVTKLNGVTHNPWRQGRTAGGSSGGSAAAVAGGLVSIASGGDGGGSIRIPAGYNGLLGMKGTYGRIPRGPGAYMRPNTVVVGCLARSVRDAARWYDVCAGHDSHDPSSLPRRVEGWETSLGSEDLAGRKVIVDPRLGGVTIDTAMEGIIVDAADALIAETGMQRVAGSVKMPVMASQWAMGNLATLLADMGDLWPRCRDDLTDEMAVGMYLAQSMYNLHTAAEAEKLRTQANETMAAAFDEVDFVITSTNPGPAFGAESAMSSEQASFVDWAKGSPAATHAFRAAMWGVRVGGGFVPSFPSRLLDWVSRRFPHLVEMGALTIPANITGNPAASIPVAQQDGLPIGMQVIARHHADPLLFDVALAVERARPWPLVATHSPR